MSSAVTMTLSAWDAACFQQLLQARLWVARLGESDVLRWWRTDGVLGPDGAFVGPRVLPKTHPVGRARIAFAAASQACRERYRNPAAMHLFHLDPWVEDGFDAFLQDSLTDETSWAESLCALDRLRDDAEPRAALKEQGVVSSGAERVVDNLPLGPDGRSLQLPDAESPSELIELMAAGFARGRPGELVVPYLTSHGDASRG